MPGRVLVHTRTTRYRHESVPAGVAALRRIDGLAVDATEDPEVFTADRLAGYAEPAFVRHLHAGVRWAAYCSG